MTAKRQTKKASEVTGSDLMDWRMPSGKTLGDSSEFEIRNVIEFLRKVADGLGESPDYIPVVKAKKRPKGKGRK